MNLALIDRKPLGQRLGMDVRNRRKGRKNELVFKYSLCVCRSDCRCLCVCACPTFVPSIESTPLRSDLGVGLQGEGAEGQPNSLCSVWVVWGCALPSSDPDYLLKKGGKKHCQSQENYTHTYLYSRCLWKTHKLLIWRNHKVMSKELTADKTH